MADELPKNLTELLAQIEREWAQLLQVVALLTPEQMTKPDSNNWSPKDHLAHLAVWMKVLMGYHMDGRPPYLVLDVPLEVTADWDMDVINPVIFEHNRWLPADEVQQELKRVYEELTAKIRSTPFADLMKPHHLDPDHRPLLAWVLGDTTEHFAEHRATIEKLL